MLWHSNLVVLSVRLTITRYICINHNKFKIYKKIIYLGVIRIYFSCNIYMQYPVFNTRFTANYRYLFLPTSAVWMDRTKYYRTESIFKPRFILGYTYVMLTNITKWLTFSFTAVHSYLMMFSNIVSVSEYFMLDRY